MEETNSVQYTKCIYFGYLALRLNEVTSEAEEPTQTGGTSEDQDRI
jgi:hypothetical protein